MSYQGKSTGGLFTGLRILVAWSVQNQRKRQSEDKKIPDFTMNEKYLIQ